MWHQMLILVCQCLEYWCKEYKKNYFIYILKPNGLHLTKVRLNFHITHSGFTILKFWPNYFNLFSPIRVLLDISMKIVIKM